MSWIDGVLTAFDTETTGVDATKARIVTAAVVRVGRGTDRSDWSCMVAVDEEIPEGATKIHGITTEAARAGGLPLGVALEQIADRLREAWKAGGVVVAFNAPFDFTILAAEMDRVGLPPLELGPIIDPYVLDKQCDTWRKGTRNLGACAEFYGVTPEQAHNAVGDAITAVRVAWRIAQKHREIAETDPAVLQDLQRKWKRGQMESLERYYRREGEDAKADGVDGGWPLLDAFTKATV